MSQPSYRAVLRTVAVGPLLATAALVRLADRMLGLVLVLDALQRFHSPMLAGWVGFAAMAPGLLVSPLAGAWLDRAGPGRGILIDLACSALCLLLLGVLTLTGRDTAWVLLGLAGLYALTNPLSFAGIRALLPRLVPPEQRARANALDTSLYAAVDVGGPALAGAAFGLAGAAAALLGIAGLYALAGLALLPALRHGAGVPVRRSTRGGLLADAIRGVAYVLRHATLRPLALGYATYHVGWGILVVAVPVFVLRTAGDGPHADFLVGALWAASGVASGAGSLLAGRHATPGSERRLMIAGMLGSAVAIWPLGAVFGLPGLAVAVVLVGALAGPVDVGVLGLRQRRTDPAWLGRVMAVSISLNLSGEPLGFALGGTMLEKSVPVAMAAAALACVAGALALRRVPPH